MRSVFSHGCSKHLNAEQMQNTTKMVGNQFLLLQLNTYIFFEILQNTWSKLIHFSNINVFEDRVLLDRGKLEEGLDADTTS